MDMRYENIGDKFDEENLKNEGKDGEKAWQLQEPPSPPATSSSPSHDFSFTISVHHPMAETAPADDIFFHGHLLPLHFLPHLPISPRSSTNSLDSFTLLLKDEDHHNHEENQGRNYINGLDHNHGRAYNDDKIHPAIKISESVLKKNYFQRSAEEAKSRGKLKQFSLFGLPKWRKNSDIKEEEEHEKHKRKLKFDIGHVLKRYIRMVRPLLSLRNKRRRSMHFEKQSYSFSGNTSFRDKEIMGRRRVQVSAPASMRTSPNNSGPLLTNNYGNIASYTSDSTMEELQAAIQAAINHCKNSIAMEENNKNNG